MNYQTKQFQSINESTESHKPNLKLVLAINGTVYTHTHRSRLHFDPSSPSFISEI